MMTDNEAKEWSTKLNELAERVRRMNLGYPLGENHVRQPATTSISLPSELEALYQVCDGLSLPDVHVGYFLDTSARAASAAARGEPVRLEGSAPVAIHVFGSDGGGGRFALGSDQQVYYLPAGGAVAGGVFVEDDCVRARRVGSLTKFLGSLAQDIEAFVNGAQEHRFIIDV